LIRGADEMSPLLIYAYKYLGPLFLKSIGQGAATQIFVLTSPEIVSVSGSYFRDCKKIEPTKMAQDPVQAQILWEKSLELMSRM